MRNAHVFSLVICIGLVMILASQVLAVMPPASAEWYQQRLKMPLPKSFGHDYPKIPPDMYQSLREAAESRPDNTDHILVILVEFPDNYAEQWSHPSEAYQELLFSEGVVPTGSLREYYEEVSYGAFSPAGTTTVWIMAPHDYIYYSDGNGMGSYPNNSEGLLEDCVNILDPTLDFSQFDNNSDGVADAIFLVHAGPGGEETGTGTDIWSHSWTYEVQTNDGVTTGRYCIEPEEYMNGDMIGIGVFCHEYGHVLGLPDLYDGDRSSEGIGAYCLMSSGSWGAELTTPERPTQLCAEMKSWLGWITPIEVTGDLDDLYIPPIETTPVCYKFPSPTDPGQYFLIANRAKVGFDSLFRGDGGLAIWHVDSSLSWFQQGDETHPFIALEQADGNFDLMRQMGDGAGDVRSNRGDAGDLYPGAAENTWFSFSSYPSSYNYDSTTAFATIENISRNGDSATVTILKNTTVPFYRFHGLAIDDDVTGYPSDFDHEADSGEAVDLVVTVACDGAGSSSLVGTIQTSDPRVTILDGEADYAPSTHNEFTSNASSPFQLHIESSDADSAVSFALHLEAVTGAVNVPFHMNINRQKVLIVLDNNSSNWSNNLVEAMYATGYSFDTLYSYPSTRLTYDDLIPYHAVLWTTASYFGNRNPYYVTDFEYCLTTDELAVLQQYLDNNGRLGLFGQDYLRDVGINSFTTDYFHLTGATQSIGSSSSLTGAGPFATGSDYFFKEWSFYDYTDLMVTHPGATTLLVNDSSGNDVLIGYPSTPQIGSYATTLGTFGIERLDDSSLTRVLTAWCQWILTNTDIDVPIPTVPANGDSSAESPTLFMWTASPGAASFTIQIATDLEFTDIIRETTVPSNSTAFAQPFDDGTYYWRVQASPDSKTATAFSPRSHFTVYTPIPPYVCGDASGDSAVNISDAVYVINYIFKGGPPPDPLCVGDADGDGAVNISDAVYLITYIFKSGPPPMEPCCP